MADQRESPEASSAGVVAALAAFAIWGVSPLYWKQISGVPPLHLIAHRLVWALLLLALVVLWRRQGRAVLQALGDRRCLGRYALSGALLSINWLTYVWAVNSGQIVETSLGYFLNPLVNVVLGLWILRERLRPAQWCAVGFAAAGVIVQIAMLARVPWIALVLALTFGLYGLLRKTSLLGPLTGLAVETALLAPAAIVFLLWAATGVRGLGEEFDAGVFALVVGTGPVTVVPLLLFVFGARRMPLAALGLLQYVAPSLQLAIGVLVYHEAFGPGMWVSFGCIWTGLALVSWDGWRESRRRKPDLSAAVP